MAPAKSLRKYFNEASFEQRVSPKDSGAVQAKGIVKIYIFSVNPEISLLCFS